MTTVCPQFLTLVWSWGYDFTSEGYNCILCFFLQQDTKNPDLTVPIPEITDPLPPEKSKCAQATVPPGPTAASERHSPVAFALLFGMLCAVIGIHL